MVNACFFPLSVLLVVFWTSIVLESTMHLTTEARDYFQVCSTSLFFLPLLSIGAFELSRKRDLVYWARR